MTDKQTQDAWLSQLREPVIDPDQRICDPHHHLWDHQGNPYLLPELLADIGDGHNVVSTVFMECGSMYRAEGPASMAPLGEDPCCRQFGLRSHAECSRSPVV